MNKQDNRLSKGGPTLDEILREQKLAQLGARVLEILRQRDALGLKDADRSAVVVGLRSEARSLGLLGEEAPR